MTPTAISIAVGVCSNPPRGEFFVFGTVSFVLAMAMTLSVEVQPPIVVAFDRSGLRVGAQRRTGLGNWYCRKLLGISGRLATQLVDRKEEVDC
jgi:hypothetical protein